MKKATYILLCSLLASHLYANPSFSCVAYGKLVVCTSHNTSSYKVQWERYNDYQSPYGSYGAGEFKFEISEKGETTIEMTLFNNQNEQVIDPATCKAFYDHRKNKVFFILNSEQVDDSQ